jgi:hypothetical protein
MPISTGFEFKESENFKHPSTICQTNGAGRNILNISRIALKLHCVPKYEPDPREIGYAFHRAGADFEKCRFAKVPISFLITQVLHP